MSDKNDSRSAKRGQAENREIRPQVPDSIADIMPGLCKKLAPDLAAAAAAGPAGGPAPYPGDEPAGPAGNGTKTGRWVRGANGQMRPADILSLGYRCVPAAIAYMHNLSRPCRRTLRVVFDYATMGDDFDAYLTTTRLALETRTTRHRAMWRLAELERAGCFSRVQRRPGLPTIYHLSGDFSAQGLAAAEETRAKLDKIITRRRRGRPAAPANPFRFDDRSLGRFGYHCVPVVLDYHDKLSALDLEVLGILHAMRRWGKFGCWIAGLESLAALTGLPVTHLRRCLRRLEALGLVNRVRRKGRLTSRYEARVQMTDAVWGHCVQCYQALEAYRAERCQDQNGTRCEDQNGTRCGDQNGTTIQRTRAWRSHAQNRGGRLRPVQALHRERERQEQRRAEQVGKPKANLRYMDEEETEKEANRQVQRVLADKWSRGESGPTPGIPPTSKPTSPVIRSWTAKAADDPALIDVLRKAGMAKAVAEELVRNDGAAKVRQAVENMPDNTRKPAGFIIDWCRKGWIPRRRRQ